MRLIFPSALLVIDSIFVFCSHIGQDCSIFSNWLSYCLKIVVSSESFFIHAKQPLIPSSFLICHGFQSFFNSVYIFKDLYCLVSLDIIFSLEHSCPDVWLGWKTSALLQISCYKSHIAEIQPKIAFISLALTAVYIELSYYKL